MPAVWNGLESMPFFEVCAAWVNRELYNLPFGFTGVKTIPNQNEFRKYGESEFQLRNRKQVRTQRNAASCESKIVYAQRNTQRTMIGRNIVH